MRKIKVQILILIGIMVYSQERDTIITASSNPEVISSRYEGYQPDYETPIAEYREPTKFENRKFKDELKERYKGEDFNYESTPPQRPIMVNFEADFLSFLMYLLLGITLAVILVYFIRNSERFSYGKEKKNLKLQNTQEEEVEDLEKIENNNFEKLIQKAKSEKEFKKAIRYYYLWTLQRLTKRELITWHKDKTDYEYFLELKNHPIRDDFSTGNYIYDHTWYGNFEINAKEFEVAESIFQRTLKKIY